MGIFTTLFVSGLSVQAYRMGLKTLKKRPTLFLEVQERSKQSHEFLKENYKKWGEHSPLFIKTGIVGIGSKNIRNFYHYYYNPDLSYMKAYVKEFPTYSNLFSDLFILPRYKKLIFRDKINQNKIKYLK